MTTKSAEFDTFAQDYDDTLQQGLELTGESKDYFAQGRIDWLRDRLLALQEKPSVVLDFGCGTGGSIAWMQRAFQPERIIGSDVSDRSLAVARKRVPDRNVEFVACGEEPAAEVDLAFCNGVFHHIAPKRRNASVLQIWNALRPNGLLAFWENNPWNPGTRYLMSKIPFDRDAILVWPGGGKYMLRKAGFMILRTDFLFYFPSQLANLRPLEPWLCKLPFGGQYLILAMKT